MSISVTSAPIGRAASRHRVVVGAGAALAVSLVLAVALSRETVPSPPLVAGAGITVLAIAWLAFVRYEAAIALGLLLLAVVRFQPAPTDAVFAIVIARRGAERSASSQTRAVGDARPAGGAAGA